MAENDCIYYAWKEAEPRDPKFPFRAIYQSKLAVEMYFGKYAISAAEGNGKIVKVKITEVKE